MEKNFYFELNLDFNDSSELEKCLKHFSISKDDDDVLYFNNFKNLMGNLLADVQGKPYDVSEEILTNLFTYFDSNSDGKIDKKEFADVWIKLIKPLVQPVTALLVIDVQNDFIDGSLALKNCPAKQDANDVIPVINNLFETHQFHVVAYAMDCHPKDHISFYENRNLFKLSEKNRNPALFDTVIFEDPPKMSQKLWPGHCIQNTWGCKLHDKLKICESSLFIYKGQNSTVDSYSAFFNNAKLSSTILHDELKKRNVTHVFVCGIAFDFCVAFTALDALELGYATVVIEDGTAGTDCDNIKEMKSKLISQNCVLTNSQEVKSLIAGKNRKPEFAAVFLNALLTRKPHE